MKYLLDTCLISELPKPVPNQKVIVQFTGMEGDIIMNTVSFESKLLSDGHLYCPKEFAEKKNALFKVTVIFDETETEISEQNIELSAVNDLSTDFLSEQELSYYLNLDEL